MKAFVLISIIILFVLGMSLAENLRLDEEQFIAYLEQEVTSVSRSVQLYLDTGNKEHLLYAADICNKIALLQSVQVETKSGEPYEPRTYLAFEALQGELARAYQREAPLAEVHRGYLSGVASILGRFYAFCDVLEEVNELDRFISDNRAVFEQGVFS